MTTKAQIPHALSKAPISKKFNRYDWIKLKTEFMSGEYHSVTEFLKAKGMNPHAPYRQVKGWASEKIKIHSDALALSTQQIVQEDAREMLDVRLRQARLARFLQVKGMNKLQNADPENVEDARKLLVSGLEQERKALGIDGGATKQNLTQINIEQPKTNLDKMLEGMDYEQILELLAEAKRERARRSIPKPTIAGSGESEEGEVK